MKASKIILSIIVILFFTACKNQQHISIENMQQRGNCIRPLSEKYNDESMPIAFAELDISDSLHAYFSKRSLLAANAIGALHQLEQLLELNNKNNGSLESKMRHLELKQSIFQKINMASLEVSSVAASMDCEEERADQIASYLQLREDRMNTRLTVAAIGVGALGAIVSGLILANNQEAVEVEYVGISIGVTEAVLGTLILMNRKRVFFQHEKNLLSDIWYAPEASTYFPKSVWYFLNEPVANADSDESIRDMLIQNWSHFNELKSGNSSEIDKIFGVGGYYSAGQLFRRADMHDQIEAQVGLFMQDLKNLMLDLQDL